MYRVTVDLRVLNDERASIAPASDSRLSSVWTVKLMGHLLTEVGNHVRAD